MLSSVDNSHRPAKPARIKFNMNQWKYRAQAAKHLTGTALSSIISRAYNNICQSMLAQIARASLQFSDSVFVYWSPGSRLWKKAPGAPVIYKRVGSKCLWFLPQEKKKKHNTTKLPSLYSQVPKGRTSLRRWFSGLSCCSGQRRRPDKKQGAVYKWSVLCFALLLQSFSFFEPFCFVSLKHIFTIIRTRTIAMPLHEALIFVVCIRALAYAPRTCWVCTMGWQMFALWTCKHVA